MATFDIGEIKAKLLAIEERKDVNDNPYLVLRTEKESLYCFPSRIPVEKGSELKTDKEYVFIAQESRIGTGNLQKFEKAEADEIGI